MTGTDSEPRELSTSGPMGRNTEDSIRLLQTIAVAPVAQQFTPLNLVNINIGWMGNFDNYLAMEPGVLDLCENSLGSIAEAGADVEPVIPEMNLFDM